jgi:polyisoprenoid-binding protein YceI
MMKYAHVYILFFVTFFLPSCGEQKKTNLPKVTIEPENRNTSSGKDEADFHTKYEYADSIGKRIIIQNGYPRGGIKYTDPSNNENSYAVFWTRIINETDNQLELNIDFPIKSYEISNFPGKYFKILVPDDTLSHDKVPILNLPSLTSFLNKNINNPSSFKRTINPKQSSGFYFVMLINTLEATGMTRTGLSLKGQDLFYKISRHSNTTLIDEKEIPLLFGCSGTVKEKNTKNIQIGAIALHADDEKYIAIDKKESVLTWKGSSVGGAHTGYVYISQGELMIENDQLVGGTLEVDMRSIEGDDHRSDNNLINHLKDPDFFDVKKFPFSTISITKVVTKNEEENEITGNLTIKGITHLVSFTAKVAVKEEMVKANGKLVIDRTLWDIRYKSDKFFDNLKDQAIADSIEFNVQIVAKK